MQNFKRMVLVSGVGALVALSGVTGCKSWEGNRGGAGERSEGRLVDDHQITSQVRDRLRGEPVYKFNDVDVKTYDGVVQLSGFVTTDEQKRRAGELAQQVPGVTQVVNSIGFKPNVPTPTGRAPEVTTPPADNNNPPR